VPEVKAFAAGNLVAGARNGASFQERRKYIHVGSGFDILSNTVLKEGPAPRPFKVVA
jgi:hypothetical protein